MGDRFDDILNECVEEVLSGGSVELCLERYPEQAPEMEPLLRVAAATRETSSAVVPRPEFKERTRYEIQSRLRSKDRKTGAKRSPMVGWIPRWAVAAACVSVILVSAGTGTVAASSDSLPGDTLYSVKTATEDIQLKLTFSEEGKARLQARFAERRAWEMSRLAEEGRTGQFQSLAARFTAHLAEIEQLAAQISATDPDDGERISELRDTLYANMARDQALLDAAEAKAPVRARTAIAVAEFRLMQKYEKAIAALDRLQARHGATSGFSGDAQSGGSGGSGPGSGMWSNGALIESGQQGQMPGMGLQVQAISSETGDFGAGCSQPS